VTVHFHVVLTLVMRGALPLLPHMSSWGACGLLNLVNSTVIGKVLLKLVVCISSTYCYYKYFIFYLWCVQVPMCKHWTVN
jgi:hypothetical protein